MFTFSNYRKILLGFHSYVKFSQVLIDMKL